MLNFLSYRKISDQPTVYVDGSDQNNI